MGAVLFQYMQTWSFRSAFYVPGAASHVGHAWRRRRAMRCDDCCAIRVAVGRGLVWKTESFED